MDYSFKLYNINLTFAVNHPVSFAFDAAYFYMQAALYADITTLAICLITEREMGERGEGR